MQNIPLQPLPNQELSFNTDGNRWLLRIKTAKTILVVDVVLNDAPLLDGQRIAVGTPLIPYEHLATNGNFLFLVDGEDLPDWTKLGISQQLLYVGAGDA